MSETPPRPPQPAPDGPVEGAVAVDLVPQFSPAQLLAAAAALIVLFVALGFLMVHSADWVGLFDDVSEGLGGTRILANTVVVWLSFIGLAMVLAGVFLNLVEARRPQDKAPAVAVQVAAPGVAAGVVTSAITGILKGVGETFKDIKGAQAVIVGGITLLLMAGALAWQSLPSELCQVTGESTTTTTEGTDTTASTTAPAATVVVVGACAPDPTTTTTTPANTTTTGAAGTPTTATTGSGGGGGTSSGDG